jgi:DNA-binding NarL/FixJ family response regulator
MMSQTSPTNENEPRLVRVLLVDDTASVRYELRQLLELSGGIQIIGDAGNGLDAVRLATETIPDVIVMDLEMPVMDGFEATRRIKALRPAPRVIILSVHAQKEEQERAREAGADSFLVKGASYQVLLNAIHGMDGPTNSNEKGEKL